MKDDGFEGMGYNDIASKIESMEIRGAAKIARAAAAALKQTAVESEKQNLDIEINKAVERLKKTRPTAVSLKNALRFVTKNKSLGFNADEIRKRAEDFIERSHEAYHKISEYGGKRIRSGDTVLTHCNSSMALGCIRYAWEAGKEIEVIATESRPKKQGYITVRELAGYGMPVTLIVDSAVRYKMKDVDKVYVGADTIASNGAVINKIGTSQVALCAHESRVPFTVCAETYKFSRETAFGHMVEIEERSPTEVVDPEEFPGVNISNPVFDATPGDYVDSIITEEGVISPSESYRVIKEMIEG